MEKSSRCRQFQANLFNKTRCQQCFKLREQHCDLAFENNKVTRKTTKCGFLYVAPDNLDFTNQSHRTRRWQRRWFILYDDGELTFALDQHPDTIPQGILDMTKCSGVSVAEEATGNPHSIRISLPTADYYVKADTAEEIKWWDEIFNMYARQQQQHKQNPTASKRISAPARIEATTNESLEAENSSGCEALLRETPVVRRSAVFSDGESPLPSATAKQSPRRRVSDPLTQINRVDGVMRTDSFHGTPRSVKHRRSAKVRSGEFSDFTVGSAANGSTEPARVVTSIRTTTTEPNCLSSDSEEDKDSANVVIRKNKSDTSWISSVGLNSITNTGGTVISVRSTPPSVRHRVALSKGDETNETTTRAKLEARFSVGSNVSAASSGGRSDSHRSDRFSPLMTKDLFDQPSVDTNMLTLRKGWLSLRKSDTEWVKHWVVLSGLSLKLFKDSWAEEGGKSLLAVDLSSCESVDPISVTRNYGIEIRSKKGRYVLSAMTPGIRDSWIGAIQQNLSNPQAISPHSDNSVEPHRSKESVKRKRIAYVPPARHGRSSSAGTSSEEDIDDVETTSVFSRSSVELEQLEIHSDEEDSANRVATPIALTPISLPSERLIEEAIRQRDEGRHRSVSPTTVRRSPVARVKERDLDRRTHSGNHSRQNSDSLAIDPLPHSPIRAESFDHHNNHARSNKAVKESRPLLMVNSGGENIVAADSQQLVESLSVEIVALRNELEATKERLIKTDQDNQRLADLHKILTSNSPPGTSVSSSADGSSSDVVGQLKANLSGDQKQIEELRQKLNSSVEEMSETESALTQSLRDLSEGGKTISVSEELSDKLSQMGLQLERTQAELKDFLIERAELQRKETAYLDEIRSLRQKLISTEAELELARVADTDRRLTDQQTVRELRTQLAVSSETVDSLVRRIAHLESIGPVRATADCDEKSVMTDVVVEEETSGPKTSSVEVESTRVLLRFFRSHSSFLSAQLQNCLDSVRWFHQPSSHTAIATKLKEAKADVTSLLKLIDQVEQQCNCDSTGNLPDEACRLIEQIEQTDSHVSSVVQEYQAKFRVREDQFAASTTTATVDAACDTPQCCVLTSLSTSSNQACSSQTDPMWSFCSPTWLHAGVTASLSECLAEKQFVGAVPLQLDGVFDSYADRMGYEIALLAEVTNLLECARDQHLFNRAVLLREIQNSFNSLVKVGRLVKVKSNDDSNLANVLMPDFVDNIGQRISSLIKETWRNCLEESSELATIFNQVKSDSTVVIHLLNCLVPTVLPTGKFSSIRQSLSEMQVDDILKRFNNQPIEVSGDNTDALVEGCLNSFEETVETLVKELDQMLSQVDVNGETTDLRAYVDQFIAAVCPHMDWSARHSHISGALKKLSETTSTVSTAQAYWMCLKATVNGIWDHVSQMVEESTKADGNELQLVTENLRRKKDEKSRMSPVDQLAWRHGPMSKQLVLNAVISVQNSLTVALMTSKHELDLAKLKESIGNSSGVVLRRPKVVRNEWKRHSANLQEIAEDTSVETEMLRRQLATNEIKHERERRRWKDEVDFWKREAELRADTNLGNEIKDLEQELVETQNAHSEELEALRASHQQSLQHLQSRLASEVEMRKKGQMDMQQMKTLSDQSLSVLEKTHERIINEIRNRHRLEMDQLIADHKQELIEEKEATKHAIEALRKSHEMDLQRCTEYSLDNQKSSQVPKPESTSFADCSEMLEDMRRELSQLSAAYSAKCLEMADVEEELSETRAIIDQLCKGAQFEQLSVWESTRHQAKSLEESLKQKEEECVQAAGYMQQLEETLLICKKEMKSLEFRIEDLSTQLESQKKSTPNGSNVATSSSESTVESHTDVAAAEYQPKTARNKRISPLARRNDFRFHSTPNLESTIVGQYPPEGSGDRRMSDASLMDLRLAMGLPVAERRRYFETLGM